MIKILGTISRATLYILIKSAICGHILMQRFPNHVARGVNKCSVKKPRNQKKIRLFIKSEFSKQGQSLKHRLYNNFRTNLPFG
jgi:hypothetical protein